MPPASYAVGADGRHRFDQPRIRYDFQERLVGEPGAVASIGVRDGGRGPG